MPTESAPRRLPPQRVYVAVYEHRLGTDVRVFTEQSDALNWRMSIAQEWWSYEFSSNPPPADEIADEYFERMLDRNEFFSIQECEVEIGSAPSADPTRPGGP